MFVAVDRIDRGRIRGRIGNEVRLSSGIRYGDCYSLFEMEPIDWTIVHTDGTEEGNLVGKFLETIRR